MKENRKGRPTNAVKGIVIKARIDEETERMLEVCIEKTSMTKSDVVRSGIMKIYNEICKGEKQ